MTSFTMIDYVCFVELGKDLAAGHAPPFAVLMVSAVSIIHVRVSPNIRAPSNAR